MPNFFINRLPNDRCKLYADALKASILKFAMSMIRSVIVFCKPRWHRFVLFACIFAFAFVVVISFAIIDKQNRSPREVYDPIDVQAIDDDVLKLTTGIYLNRIHDVDRTSGTFSADGWLWASWDKPQDDAWHEDQISIDTIKFMNEIPNSSKRVNLLEAPAEEYGSRMWQGMRFSSTFLLNNQDYSHFPFESIELPIEIGSDEFSVDYFVYMPNLNDSLVSNRLALSGFEFRGIQARNSAHSIVSRWGHSIDPNSDFNRAGFAYPHLEWVFQFSRLASSSIARLFMPVFSTMVVLMFSLLTNLKTTVPKITIPASVLLVLAVLQDRSHRLLPPDLTYLTYMDKIYMFCYVLTLISLVSSLYCVNRMHLASAHSVPSLMISLGYQQRALVGWMSISIVIIPLFLWFF